MLYLKMLEYNLWNIIKLVALKRLLISFKIQIGSVVTILWQIFSQNKKVD